MMRGLFASGTPNKQDAFADFLNNPWSSLLVFGVVLFSVIITIPLMSVINKVSYKAMQDNVEGNREYGYFYTLGSNYQYGKDIRLFHLRPLILGLQDGKRFGVNKIWNRFSFFEAGYQIVLALFDALSSFVAYGFLGLKALYGLLSVGNALAYAGAIFLLGSGLKKIGESFVNQVLIANYLQNYFIYLALPDDLSYGTEKLDESKPLSIAFNHISFTYPHQKEKALDDVSLVITPGEKLAIVGANGAGKTTLMKLICRFYEPDSGEILLNDKPLKSYDEQSCYRLYSIVFQDFKLFSYSLKENVASNDSVDEEKVVASLKKAGIYERAMAFPQGLDTVLLNKNDENGVELSGGEAQKIAIARALYKDSPLVILDEPTSALDPKSEADIYERFGTLVEKKTSVFISHRMSSTKFCDEIAVIDKGRLIEYGNHDELIKLNGIYKKMWDAQAQYYR
jgi:ATP-binding cassette subfamily B protein